MPYSVMIGREMSANYEIFSNGRLFLVGEGSVELKHLPPAYRGQAISVPGMITGTSDITYSRDSDEHQLPIGTTLEEVEKDLIVRTLAFTKNNNTRAAYLLGISLKRLHSKLNEYGATNISTR
jgi:DNA-binding NtrC family response regulator